MITHTHTHERESEWDIYFMFTYTFGDLHFFHFKKIMKVFFSLALNKIHLRFAISISPEHHHKQTHRERERKKMWVLSYTWRYGNRIYNSRFKLLIDSPIIHQKNAYIYRYIAKLTCRLILRDWVSELWVRERKKISEFISGWLTANPFLWFNFNSAAAVLLYIFICFLHLTRDWNFCIRCSFGTS